MENSILLSVKNAASIDNDETIYDAELLLHINSAFMILRQLGVGPETPFIVDDYDATWDSFTTDENILPLVRSYVSLKTRLLFDPPTSSALETALQNTIAEYEWRLNIEADKYDIKEVDNSGEHCDC